MNDDVVAILLRIEGELGEMRSELRALRDLHDRVSKLENAKSWVAGAWAALGVVLSAASGFIYTLLKGPNANQ